MINLLKFEFRKLWQSKSFYIVFALGFVSIVLMMLLGKLVFNITPNATLYMIIGIPNSMLVGIQGLSMASLLGVYLAIYVCSDYGQHTIKNIYARGYSRSAVFFSKYLVSLGVTLFVGLIYVLFTFVFALILGGHADGMSSYMWGKLILQFWVLFGFHGMFFGISMMLGKVAGSLAINIVGVELVFVLLNALISILGTKFNFEFNIMNYNLGTILNTLSSDAQLINTEFTRALVMPIVYTVVCVGGGWLINRRRDV